VSFKRLLLLLFPLPTQDPSPKKHPNRTQQLLRRTHGLSGSSVWHGALHRRRPGYPCSSSIVFRYHEDGVFYPAEIVRGVGNGRFEHHDKDHLWLHFGALKSTAGGLYPSLSTKMKNRRLLLQTCDRLEGLIIYLSSFALLVCSSRRFAV
jgi:hypothetical protein